MELLKQVHGDKGQQAVLGCADGIALVLLGHSFIFLLVGAVAGQHRPPSAVDSLRGTFAWKGIGWGVPTSPRVFAQELPTAMSHPMETLHQCSLSCSLAPHSCVEPWLPPQLPKCCPAVDVKQINRLRFSKERHQSDASFD